MTRITMACPKALFDDYIALRRSLVPTQAEADMPPEAAFAWRNAAGALFAVSSAAGGAATWFEAVQAPLIAPAWGADMEAAARAQARISLWSGTGAAAVATDERITIVRDMAGPAALSAIGLTSVAGDGPI